MPVMFRSVLAALAATLLFTADSGYVDRRLERARALIEQKSWSEARSVLSSALEGDPGHPIVLALLAQVDLELNAQDDALYDLNRLAESASHHKDLTKADRALIDPLLAKLKQLDPVAGKRDSARDLFRQNLLKLAQDHLGKKRYHSALAVYQELLTIDPDDQAARAGLKQVQKEGGNELAAQGLAGGEDLLGGVTPQWIEENDRQHVAWDNAWEKKTKNYTVFTNAGYEMLQVVGAAMEQLNHFYRIFHQYKTDGSDTPHIAVKIYRTHQQYTELGHPPMEWAGGHYDGSSVQTWDYREGQKGSLDGTLSTLAHEASHQFVQLACGAVPPWLNEGMASFFEGTQYLSNGQIRWNLVAPGRLLPLADSLEKEPVALADVLTGKVDDYRVYYPYGWGIVYFLYNAETEHGQLRYRDLLTDYAKTYPGGVDAVERFTDYFVTRAKQASIQSFAQLEQEWRRWILRLRDIYLGHIDVADEYERVADELAAAGSLARALEKYELLLSYAPDRAGAVFKLAVLLEKMGLADRASGAYREFLRLAQFQEMLLDPRVAEAEKKVGALDPLHEAASRRRGELDQNLLLVAKGYREAKRPLMALYTVRDLVVSDTPFAPAREMYLDVERDSGKSLEAWRAIFNEADLDGFETAGVAENYRAQNLVIAGHVVEAVTTPSAPHTGPSRRRSAQIEYRMLLVTRQVNGDYSLEVEMRAGAACQLMGMVFGSKGGRAPGSDPNVPTFDFFHAALLKADGTIDISTFENESWKIRAGVKPEMSRREWTTVRADIAGARLQLTVNGKLAKELDFASAAELRGRFGLLLGGGDAEFRNIRLLERDPRLPPKRGTAQPEELEAAEVTLTKPEREKAGLGSYRGLVPPPLRASRYYNTEPVTLDDLIGKVVVLGFMQADQEQGIPSLPAYQKIVETYEGLDVRVLLVVSEKGSVVEKLIKDKGIRLPVLQDAGHQTLLDYNISSMPHAKVIDMDGRVVWEGNPDWRPGEDSYLAAPVQELVDKRGLALIARAPALFTEADRAFAAGDPFAAAAALDKLAGLGAPHPVVIEAQHKMREARRRATQLCELARERFQAGRLQAATDLAGRVVKAFPKLPPAQSIATELSAPEPSAALKRERKAMDLLMSVVPFLERGSVKPAARQLAPLNKDQLDPQARLLAQTLDGLFAEEAPKESVAPRALAIVRAYPDLDRVEELLRTGGEDPARELLSRCEPILAKTPLAPRLAQLKEKLSSKG